MQVCVILSVTGLILISIGKDMESEATAAQWSSPNNNEVTLSGTTDRYVKTNATLKFNRVNRVKAKWSGNDLWEAQARHASNYTLSSYSTSSTTPPKRGNGSKPKRRKASINFNQHRMKDRPIKRIPAKIKKSGQLHRRTRPISPKKASTTTTTTPKSTTTLTTKKTTTTSPPKKMVGNGYGYGNFINNNMKLKSGSINIGGVIPKTKYKRKPSRPVIRVTVTDQPISHNHNNETEMTTTTTTTVASTSPSPTTTTATAPTRYTYTQPPTTRITTIKTTTTTTTTQAPNSSSPTQIVNLPSHLTKRPILPSRTVLVTKKTTTSTPAPALSTTTQKYYPKTSNTLLSLLSASTTPAVTIPNTPFLFMEDNSFLTRLSISLFYSSIAIAPVIFTLFNGLVASKRKRKKRDLTNYLYPIYSSKDLPYSFQNHMNKTHSSNNHPYPYHTDEHYAPHHKSLPHFLAELLKEIESSLATKEPPR